MAFYNVTAISQKGSETERERGGGSERESLGEREREREGKNFPMKKNYNNNFEFFFFRYRRSCIMDVNFIIVIYGVLFYLNFKYQKPSLFSRKHDLENYEIIHHHPVYSVRLVLISPLHETDQIHCHCLPNLNLNLTP